MITNNTTIIIDANVMVIGKGEPCGEDAVVLLVVELVIAIVLVLGVIELVLVAEIPSVTVKRNKMKIIAVEICS